MRRLSAVILLSLTVAAPAPAQTQSVITSVVTQLRDDGYVVTETGRTWLGRIRIIARRGDQVREVVVSRSTGEIKQDATFTAQESEAPRRPAPAGSVALTRSSGEDRGSGDRSSGDRSDVSVNGGGSDRGRSDDGDSTGGADEDSGGSGGGSGGGGGGTPDRTDEDRGSGKDRDEDGGSGKDKDEDRGSGKDKDKERDGKG